jgi:hypothetical protein
MSTTICLTLPLCITTLSCSFVLYAASFNSTGHSVFSKSCNNSVATNTNTSTRTNEDHLAEEEVIVLLVDKFGLCWRGDFPPALTCASQVSLRIPFSMTTTTNRLPSTISRLWIFQAVFHLGSRYLFWHWSTKGLNAWLDLLKEEIPSFSKPLPDRIPQQQQWLYLSCSLTNYSLLHGAARTMTTRHV